MRTLRTQRFIIGFFALILFLGLSFFVYSRSHEVSFSRSSALTHAKNLLSNETWKEEVNRFQNKDSKQGGTSAVDTLKPKNPANLTEQLASVFSGKMVTDSQFDISRLSGKEDEFGQEILNSLDKNQLRKNKDLAALNLILPLEDEIKISRDNSEENIRKYLDTVHVLLKKPYVLKNPNTYFPKKSVNEPEMVSHAITTQDFSELLGLADFLEGRVVELRAVSVPSSTKELHRKTIAFFAYNARLYRGMSTLKTDPMLALVALQKFQELDKPLYEILQDTNTIKQIAGITYAK